MPRLLGFIALASLFSAALFGYRSLKAEPGLRKAIGVLSFCSLGGIVTSYTRRPAVIWPLAIAMLGAMLFLVWTMHCEAKRKRLE